VDESELASYFGYVPEFLTLPFGWFGLVFKAPEDVKLILNRFLGLRRWKFMLKRWRMGLTLPQTTSVTVMSGFYSQVYLSTCGI
jgi:hypothetical protein